jgi:hypothetical protein
MNTLTPNPMDQILKWVATMLLIAGTAINSLGYYPEGPLVMLAGGLIWLIVSIRWREPSLIVTNGVLSLVSIVGLLYKHQEFIQGMFPWIF